MNRSPGMNKLTLGFWVLMGVLARNSAGEQVLPYATGTWDAAQYGNHRIVIRVEEGSDAVQVHIPWRRRDEEPQIKNLILVDAALQTRILNILPLKVDREAADIVFQPRTVPGEYHLYYLPHQLKGRSNYPAVVYPPPERTAERDWLRSLGLETGGPPPASWGRDIPQALALRAESIDDFNSFFPMEVIATGEETQALIDGHPEAELLLFPEDAGHPVRMASDLPFRWVARGPGGVLELEARRGEYVPFQVGLYACRKDVTGLSVEFADLRDGRSRGSVPATALNCLNTGGRDWDGRRLMKDVTVPRGKVQTLWCGIQVPENQLAGRYEGSLLVRSGTLPGTPLRLVLTVHEGPPQASVDDDPAGLSRLRWLDSGIALDDEIVRPFVPLRARGRTVDILGRRLVVGAQGLPASLKSFFSPEVTAFSPQGLEILSRGMRFVVVLGDGRPLVFKDQNFNLDQPGPGVVRWRSRSRAFPLTLDVAARMEFDGFVEFQVELTAAGPLDVRDIRLEIPLRREAARYMMGLGFRGGIRPASFHWMWDKRNNQDALWLGAVHGGLQVSLRGDNYSRPLNTNFYLSKPLNLPPSWWNGGRGGCRLDEPDGETVLFTAYSGPRTLARGEGQSFHFNLLLTPFKLLDPGAQFRTRFFHAFKSLDDVSATGANTINIHHATPVNPYINYPFLRPVEMKTYVDEAHRRGFKVKIYYTIRELSNRAAELFALRSLGPEVFSPGPGGGFSWLQEHLEQDYIPAWFVPDLQDAAIINSGLSRWHNYYLEGLDWLARKVGIDGLYLDDLAFDRTTMKRVRKVLDRRRPGALLDLHSANQFNPRDGFASSANLYLEHFPYLDRLWFGEYFDYGSNPDYWLVEVSGIPFGLMGEMLQDGGNPWRGMVFGMTNRLPWSGNDPGRLWKVWDAFGLAEAEMIGWWSPRCPVKPDSGDVLATAFLKEGSALIALAGWNREDAQVKLAFDWQRIGLDPERSELYAPPVDGFQPERTFRPEDPIPVEPGKGWLLWVRRKS